MSKSRFRWIGCLAILAVSLALVAVQAVGPAAAAAEPQPNARALARVMAVQDRNTARLMSIQGVVGTATGLNAAGRPVVKVYMAQPGVAGIPGNVEGVPVAVELSGEFFALPKPPKPPGKDKDKPPTVTITSPPDGQILADTVTVTAQAADDKGVTQVEFFVDAARITVDTVAPYEASWNTLDCADDGYRVTAVATDTRGQTSSDSIDVFVDNVLGPPPDVSPDGRPSPIGVSTGNEGECSAGTIGCLVTDGEDVYALSNNHVYALENNAPLWSKILQPGLYDTPCKIKCLDQVIGYLFDFEPIRFRGRRNKIDAAIAITTIYDVGNSTPPDGYGTPKSATVAAFVEQAVQKYGRTTGLTKGKVDSINATVLVGYGARTARFVDQIIVIGAPGFILPGDSGSVLVSDPGKNPVGLLFAGTELGDLAVANRIDLVLDAFGVTIDGE